MKNFLLPLCLLLVGYANQNGNNIGITSGTITSFDAAGFTINIDSFADGLLVIFEAHR